MLSSSSVRVRLHFDYPPPGEERRRVWLLVDLDQCRVVADLEHVIRERFSLSSRSVLNLFIDGCYLPPTESIRVVRDNDLVSVQVDGRSADPEESRSSKRSRRHSEVEPEVTDVFTEGKKKKRRKKTEGREDESEPCPPEEEEEKHMKKKKERKEKTAGGREDESEPYREEEKEEEEGAHKKHLKKKKKKKKQTPMSSIIPLTPSEQQVNKIPKPVVLNGPKPVLNGPKPVLNGPKPVLNGPKPVLNGGAEEVSSSASSDSEVGAPAPCVTSKGQKKTPRKTPAPPRAPAPPRGPLKAPPASGKRAQPPSSSSSSDSSSEDTRARSTAPPPGGPRTPLTPQTAPPPGGPRAPLTPQTASRPALGGASRPSDSSSEEEIKLVIRRPLGAEPCVSSRGRGRGRGQPRGGGGVNGGRGEGWVGRGTPLDYEQEERRHRPALEDSLTHQSAADPRPRKDYSSLPLLAAPPGAGQRIVFKLLELTENYTPEVSEYKEGKILHFDHATKQVEMELLASWQAPAEPGKFDLVYQNADGSESVEYAVSRSGSRVTERWDSLLEPRLLL
ncbi:coilin isoform X2 [Gadus macrocephalus]|uniref:coilin isoform X2 n=1 Tax=Gadus macrocephalus TaxID=80720 RepID=UPI0028CB2FC5|nr:coilin isoform X2 [Gadus macrocephalus]XP_059902011.1 coilin isoform X2 [Gadus macrocephalus]